MPLRIGVFIDNYDFRRQLKTLFLAYLKLDIEPSVVHCRALPAQCV